MENIGKILLLTGIFIGLVGILLIFLDKLPFNIGKLPGDIYIKKDNFTFYFPLTTSIVLSILLSLILFLISRLSK